MNWGVKIAVMYLAFVALILVLVFTCLGQNTELEYKDYYAREIKYQDQIDARANAIALSGPIDYAVADHQINLQVPTELVGNDTEGTIELLRPSNSKLDRTYTVKLDAAGHQSILDPTLEKGVYKMLIRLSKNHKDYFKEAIITLN